MLGNTSNPRIKAADAGVKITVNPDSDVPQLSAHQLQLIEGYKQKYGFDLTNLMGKIPVEATVSFNTADKEATSREKRNLQQKAIASSR